MSGVLVPAGDVPAFATAIASLLRDATRAAGMGEAARAVILGGFARAAIAGRWLACYKELVPDPRPSA